MLFHEVCFFIWLATLLFSAQAKGGLPDWDRLEGILSEPQNLESLHAEDRLKWAHFCENPIGSNLCHWMDVHAKMTGGCFSCSGDIKANATLPVKGHGCKELWQQGHWFGVSRRVLCG